MRLGLRHGNISPIVLIKAITVSEFDRNDQGHKLIKKINFDFFLRVYCGVLYNIDFFKESVD